jgi:N-acetylglutamate synthase-like GNAT family acetyltransferase
VSAALRLAEAGDWPAIARLLERSGLPLAGARDHLSDFLVAHDGRGLLTGCVGPERHGAHVLLRSLAVEPGWRSRGIGRALVDAALARARSLGAAEVTLLTTTARDYFAVRGFRPVARADVPAPLLASEELRGACPESATILQITLGRSKGGRR